MHVNLASIHLFPYYIFDIAYVQINSNINLKIKYQCVNFSSFFKKAL
jgi:hypothetical protein